MGVRIQETLLHQSDVLTSSVDKAVTVATAQAMNLLQNQIGPDRSTSAIALWS